MKHLAFYLSFPNRGSWNGKWSGEGDLYAKYISIPNWDHLPEFEKEWINRISNTAFYYNFGDGWGAQISTKLLDSNNSDNKSEIARIRRKSLGFYGYDWMIYSILKFGEIYSKVESVTIYEGEYFQRYSPFQFDRKVVLLDVEFDKNARVKGKGYFITLIEKEYPVEMEGEERLRIKRQFFDIKIDKEKTIDCAYEKKLFRKNEFEIRKCYRKNPLVDFYVECHVNNDCTSWENENFIGYIFLNRKDNYSDFEYFPLSCPEVYYMNQEWKKILKKWLEVKNIDFKSN